MFSGYLATPNCSSLNVSVPVYTFRPFERINMELFFAVMIVSLAIVLMYIADWYVMRQTVELDFRVLYKTSMLKHYKYVFIFSAFLIPATSLLANKLSGDPQKMVLSFFLVPIGFAFIFQCLSIVCFNKLNVPSKYPIISFKVLILVALIIIAAFMMR